MKQSEGKILGFYDFSPRFFLAYMLIQSQFLFLFMLIVLIIKLKVNIDKLMKYECLKRGIIKLLRDKNVSA